MKKRYVLYIGTLIILSIFLIKRNREKNIILPDIIIPPPEWNMPEAEETMPKIKDIIADGEKTTALCGDGSVWQWKKGQDREDAVRVEGLENIRKIMYAGPAMYALSEDGHVYMWGCNKLLWFRDVGEEPEYYEEAQEVAGLTDIVDMDTSVDTGNERVRAFAIDGSGNLYVWGLDRSFIEKEDFIPEILNGNREAGEGVVSVFAGAGRHHFFVRENETIFSIMDDFRFFWKYEYAYDLIFPVLPIAESETGQEEMLFLMDIPYEDLRKGTKTGFTISYELGSDGTVTCIGADKYTVFMAREDNSLWYWDSKMIPFHDCKEAQVDPEIGNQDYSGNWERVTAGDIAGMAQEDGGPLPIADICAGSDNVLFLTKNGQVFISEYVTCEVRDVEYYNHTNTNPYRERTLTAQDLEIKELSFRKLDWENIVSINTDGTCHFTAVDENGECFYMDISAISAATTEEGAEAAKEEENKESVTEFDDIVRTQEELDMIGKMTALRKLEISLGYDLNEKLDFSALGNLEELQELSLNFDYTAGANVDFSFISKLDKLEILYINKAEIKDLSFLSESQDLKELYLKYVDDCDLACLQQLKRIERLHVYGHIRGHENLKDLVNMKELCLEETEPFSDQWINTDLQFTENMGELKILSLVNTLVDSVEPLAQNRKLEIVTLVNTGFTDISPLWSLEHLRELNIYGAGAETVKEQAEGFCETVSADISEKVPYPFGT